MYISNNKSLNSFILQKKRYKNNSILPHIEINLKDIIFDHKVQTYCNNPGFKCPNYDHSWACPPEAPYLEKEVSQYSRFFLIYYQFELDPYVREVQSKHPRRRREKIINALFWDSIVRDYLEREIIEFIDNLKDNYQEIRILWDGFCRVCFNKKDKGCTYDSGKPCRYPKKIRYSMEASGIDVNATAKNANIKLEWPPSKDVYRFGLVCLK